MTPVEATTLLLGLVALNIVIMAVLWRLKKGRFRVDRDDSHLFQFHTDYGRFTIDRRRLVFTTVQKGRSHQIPLDSIKRLDFTYHEKWAGWQELFTGLDLWDLSGRYRDKTEWYEISVVVGNEKTPVFLVGQYPAKCRQHRTNVAKQVAVLAPQVGLGG